MKTYHEFHDGLFEGLWIDDKRVHVFLSTSDKQRFTMVVEGLAGLHVDDLKKGNIIFEVVTKANDEWSEDDVEALPELQMIDKSKTNVLLIRAREQKLSLLEINPSYGGSCLALAQSFELLTRKEWWERHLFAAR